MATRHLVDDWWNREPVATLTATTHWLEIYAANAKEKRPFQFPKDYKLPCRREDDDG